MKRLSHTFCEGTFKILKFLKHNTNPKLMCLKIFSNGKNYDAICHKSCEIKFRQASCYHVLYQLSAYSDNRYKPVQIKVLEIEKIRD